MNCQQYAKLFTRKLELTQKYGNCAIEVHLCFGPIGTNIMFLATELLTNSRMGYKTVITRGVYEFDETNLRNFNRKHGANHAALPWILQRYDGHQDDTDPWGIWFRGLSNNDAYSESHELELDEIDRELRKLRPFLRDPHLFELGLCVSYVLRFNPKSIQEFEKKDVIGDKNCIAVHIRRGDACSDDMMECDPDRKHISLDTYAKVMEKHVNSGVKYFYILTESQHAIDYLRHHFNGRACILSQDVDRSDFIDLSRNVYGEQNYVEFLCLDNPTFLKSMINSALVDIYNTQKCKNIICTLNSQFSALNCFNLIGRSGKIIEFVDLSDYGYQKLLFHPSIQSRKSVNVLIVKERDVGLFSLFLQVINILLCIEEQHLPYVVYVDFGEYQHYFSGCNTWSSCFDDIYLLNKGLVQRFKSIVLEDYKSKMNSMRSWDRNGDVFQVSENVFWTGSYYPTLGRESYIHHIDHQRVPTEKERQRGSKVIGQFLKPKKMLLKKVEDFCNKNFDGCYVLGVQYRGSDARKDFRRKVASYSDFKDKILRHMESMSDKTAIFVATDESEFLNYMHEHFPVVYAVSTVRHEQNDGNVKTAGPLGQSMPSFIGKDKTSAVEGVMLDYLILCRSDYLIHSAGSVANAVLLTKPALKSELIGIQYKSNGIFPKFLDGCKIEFDDGFVNLIHPDNPNKNMLAEEAVGKLCQMCDGWNTIPKIIQKLNCKLPSDEQWGRKKLLSVLHKLSKKGFITE